MGSPFVAEIRLFAGNFAPQGWMTCDGQLVPISENTALFNLIGTTYGGDGVTTFALPNLSGRLPIHMGTSTTGTAYVEGQSGGAYAVTLAGNQLPVHSHTPTAAGGAGATGTPTGAFYADATPALAYSVPGGANNPVAAKPVSMNAGMVAVTGGGQPHDNVQPYVAMLAIISLFGMFPSQN